jgi:hypothetical protein
MRAAPGSGDGGDSGARACTQHKATEDTENDDGEQGIRRQGHAARPGDPPGNSIPAPKTFYPFVAFLCVLCGSVLGVDRPNRPVMYWLARNLKVGVRRYSTCGLAQPNLPVM